MGEGVTGGQAWWQCAQASSGERSSPRSAGPSLGFGTGAGQRHREWASCETSGPGCAPTSRETALGSVPARPGNSSGTLGRHPASRVGGLTCDMKTGSLSGLPQGRCERRNAPEGLGLCKRPMLVGGSHEAGRRPEAPAEAPAVLPLCRPGGWRPDS